MARVEKLMQLHQILDGRRTPISVADLAIRLECSEKTVRRTLDVLRDDMSAPLLNARKGWFYDRNQLDEWNVPGLWMTREESQSLLLLIDMLNRLGKGVLSDELRSIRKRLDTLLDKRGVDRSELERKLHVVPIGQRAMPSERLHQVLNALIDNKRLALRYRDYKGKISQRTVSPQRLVYYRDNWYLAAWCHQKKDLRIFSVARIEFSAATDESAAPISEKILNGYFDGSYGVFAGEPRKTAKLRFLPAVASEIACQSWHPAQRGIWDGSDYLLTVPYSESAELLQDILRYLPHVVIEEPDELGDQLVEVLHQALSNMTTTGYSYRKQSVHTPD